MLLTGENVHDYSEVQESRPRACLERMKPLLLEKNVRVCLQVCMSVRACPLWEAVRNDEVEDTGMRTVLLDVLSCAPAGHGPEHYINACAPPQAHYCLLHFTDQETEAASSQVTPPPPGPSASAQQIQMQETRFQIPDGHHSGCER